MIHGSLVIWVHSEAVLAHPRAKIREEPPPCSNRVDIQIPMSKLGPKRLKSTTMGRIGSKAPLASPDSTVTYYYDIGSPGSTLGT